MIDSLKVSVGGLDLDARLDRLEHATGADQEIEIGVDQHYGIKVIVRGGEWTKIRFREAGGWSAPMDTRELIRSVFARKLPTRPKGAK